MGPTYSLRHGCAYDLESWWYLSALMLECSSALDCKTPRVRIRIFRDQSNQGLNLLHNLPHCPPILTSYSCMAHPGSNQVYHSSF